MTDGLLITKLQPPPLRRDLVPREHLLARLDQVLACQVALVSAPAGFGKTTLVAAWAARCPTLVAWLSLEPADNDPARFLSYLVGALRRVHPVVGQSTQAMLQAPHLLPAPALLLPLINELAGGETHLVLVLDDYHLIETQGIHDALTHLIDHQPPTLHLVLATRADPPLPMARLRGRGQLVELRQADLRFAEDECAAFLRLASSVPLSPANVQDLADRTEGWVAGLQMAAASLHSAPDADGFVRAFAGTQRHILDYLGEEILLRQPPDLQRFLLRTSILGQLCAPLCDAVMREVEPPAEDPSSQPVPTPSRSPSAALLQRLEHANLFVTPLDEPRTWYRYHQLFAELLQHHLRQSEPALVPVLHRRASRWFEQQGRIEDAIDHALAAGDHERAAGLVQPAAESFWMRGSITTLLAWLDALPEQVIRSRPGLCVYRALGPILSGKRLAEAEAWLKAASAGSGSGAVEGEVAVLGSVLALHRGDAATGRRLAEQACASLPVTSPFFGLARRNLSTFYLLRGEFAQAAAILETSLPPEQSISDRVGAAADLRRLGLLRLVGGQLRAAWDFYQRSASLSQDSSGRYWPMAGRALAHLAELSYEWDDLDAAERYLAESMALSAQIAPTWNTTAYVTLARLRQARGDPAGARAALDQARQLAAQSDTAMDDNYVAAHQARLALAQKDLSTAEAWAANRQPSSAARRPTADVDGLLRSAWAQELDALTLARFQLAHGQPEPARALLTPLLEEAERQGRSRSAIEILVLLALAGQAAGDPSAAQAALRRSLALAEPEGYVRTFIDAGEQLAPLLRQVSGRQRIYAERLLAALGAEPGEAEAHSGLTERLTERELDILRLIAAGLSNRELGDELHLAAGTVKSYTYSLYGKLGVHSRTQAVLRGRSLGLLPQL
jgi:LuxR family maltose regulon positive regulatory protein